MHDHGADGGAASDLSALGARKLGQHPQPPGCRLRRQLARSTRRLHRLSALLLRDIGSFVLRVVPSARGGVSYRPIRTRLRVWTCPIRRA